MQETIRHSLCGSGPFLGRAIMVPYTRAAQQISTWEKKTTVQEFSTPWASSTWWHAIGASQAFGTRGASPWELSLKQRSWESVYPGTQQPAGQTNKNRQGWGRENSLDLWPRQKLSSLSVRVCLVAIIFILLFEVVRLVVVGEECVHASPSVGSLPCQHVHSLGLFSGRTRWPEGLCRRQRVVNFRGNPLRRDCNFVGCSRVGRLAAGGDCPFCVDKKNGPSPQRRGPAEQECVRFAQCCCCLLVEKGHE